LVATFNTKLDNLILQFPQRTSVLPFLPALIPSDPTISIYPKSDQLSGQNPDTIKKRILRC